MCSVGLRLCGIVLVGARKLLAVALGGDDGEGEGAGAGRELEGQEGGAHALGGYGDHHMDLGVWIFSTYVRCLYVSLVDCVVGSG